MTRAIDCLQLFKTPEMKFAKYVEICKPLSAKGRENVKYIG